MFITEPRRVIGNVCICDAKKRNTFEVRRMNRCFIDMPRAIKKMNLVRRSENEDDNWRVITFSFYFFIMKMLQLWVIALSFSILKISSKWQWVNSRSADSALFQNWPPTKTSINNIPIFSHTTFNFISIDAILGPLLNFKRVFLRMLKSKLSCCHSKVFNCWTEFVLRCKR